MTSKFDNELARKILNNKKNMETMYVYDDNIKKEIILNMDYVNLYSDTIQNQAKKQTQSNIVDDVVGFFDWVQLKKSETKEIFIVIADIYKFNEHLEVLINNFSCEKLFNILIIAINRGYSDELVDKLCNKIKNNIDPSQIDFKINNDMIFEKLFKYIESDNIKLLLLTYYFNHYNIIDQELEEKLFKSIKTENLSLDELMKFLASNYYKKTQNKYHDIVIPLVVSKYNKCKDNKTLYVKKNISEYKVGDLCLANDGSYDLPSIIIKISDESFLVHFIRFESRWDSWVSKNKVKPYFTTEKFIK